MRTRRLFGLLIGLTLAVSACAGPAVTPVAPTATLAIASVTPAPATSVPTQAATAVPPTVSPTEAPPTQTAAPVATTEPTIEPTLAPVPAVGATLHNPSHLAFDAAGNLYVSQCAQQQPQLLKIDTQGMLTIFASTHQGYGGDGGPAVTAGIGCATGLAFDQAGNLYVSDLLNGSIRRIGGNGVITTVVGGGSGTDGGPALGASIAYPMDVVFDAGGNMYILDSGNRQIRKVDTQGIISTVAGDGSTGFSGDGGPAIAAEFDFTWGDPPSAPAMAIGPDGNLYIADSSNGRVRKIDQKGIITTIAGKDGPKVSGDGGPATQAVLGRPTGLAFDAAGNLFIATADSDSILNSSIRRVDARGIITTVAGTGKDGFGGDGGPATAAELYYPWGMAFDQAGNLYVADAGNARVRRIDSKGIIQTVAGGPS